MHLWRPGTRRRSCRKWCGRYGSLPTRPVVRVTSPSQHALLGLDSTPGHLEGYGAIPADLAAQVATDATWQRLLTDPVTGILTDYSTTTYQPGKVLRQAVIARDQSCGFLQCDALRPMRPGPHPPLRPRPRSHDPPTRHSGTDPRPESATPVPRHHLLKTHHGWTPSATPTPGSRPGPPHRAPTPDHPPSWTRTSTSTPSTPTPATTSPSKPSPAGTYPAPTRPPNQEPYPPAPTTSPPRTPAPLTSPATQTSPPTPTNHPSEWAPVVRRSVVQMDIGILIPGFWLDASCVGRRRALAGGGGGAHRARADSARPRVGGRRPLTHPPSRSRRRCRGCDRRGA